MAHYRYRILNVFARQAYAGNPLAVFEHAEGLSDAHMLQLTQQLNLSESTFIFRQDQSLGGDARVRIFTPGYEMPFAGHPSLGTAWALAQDRAASGAQQINLGLRAGVIPVEVDGDYATLTANAPTYRAAVPTPQLAAALGIPASAIVGEPVFVNTGSEQLVVPLGSPADVAACMPAAALFIAAASNNEGRACALVWAWASTEEITARFFWMQGGVMGEDFGTGSACANLGGWMLRQTNPPTALPLRATMIQGHGVGRLAHLQLTVEADGRIRVGGRVVAVGSGEFTLDDAADATGGTLFA